MTVGLQFSVPREGMVPREKFDEGFKACMRGYYCHQNGCEARV